jgi:hypothetical protein
MLDVKLGPDHLKVAGRLEVPFRIIEVTAQVNVPVVEAATGMFWSACSSATAVLVQPLPVDVTVRV